VKLMRLKTWFHLLSFALVTAASALAGHAGAADAPAPTGVRSMAMDTPASGQAATVRLLNREIATFRSTVAGSAPAKRVEQTRQRFRELPDSAMDLPLRALPFDFEQTRGTQFMFGDFKLFALVEGDVDAENRQTLDALTQQTLARLEAARKTWHATRDRPLLLLGLAKAVAGTAALLLLVWAVSLGKRRVVSRLEAARERLAARTEGVDWRELLARLTVATINLAQWLALVLLGILWLQFVLSSFVATQPLSDELVDWLWGKLAWVADGAVASVPGIATVVVVLLLTRATADVLGYFFSAVQQGRLELPFLHRETTTATRRIVTLLVWGLGVAIAYPYLPGSSSDAFKGLSVLLGLMVTLGSAGLVTQAMSGLVVIYARALRKGDFVEVNGVQGVVTEVASLAIKVINVRNEEITIPNSVIVSSPIHNYSKLASTHGTLMTVKVTIGYDAPWRQVHAMLEEAARRTPRVRTAPAPYVYQRALADFYVEYELFVSIDRALDRIPIQSALHASIQDVFNEHGVQIMSPHFLGQPAQAVVVPTGDWFKAPARKPL
jgi:small-conductance mechanosensitive channel